MGKPARDVSALTAEETGRTPHDGSRRRSSRRNGGCSRDGRPAHLELQAHRERDDAWNNRKAVPSGRLRATYHLYAPGAPGGASTMRKSDPIVDEVRAARDAIAKEFDYDIERIAQAIKAREVLSGREVVRLAPRKVTVVVRKAS